VGFKRQAEATLPESLVREMRFVVSKPFTRGNDRLAGVGADGVLDVQVLKPRKGNLPTLVNVA
jgi:hypothetical protein